MLPLVTHTNKRPIWFLSNEKLHTCNRSYFRGNGMHPPPQPPLYRAHVVLHLHHQAWPRLRSRAGQPSVTWAARPPSCRAEEGRPSLAAVCGPRPLLNRRRSSLVRAESSPRPTWRVLRSPRTERPLGWTAGWARK